MILTPLKRIIRPGGILRPRTTEFAPARPIWKGLTPIRGAALKVRFETAICDRHGRLERILQRGANTITNWGMDQLASTFPQNLTSPTNISVVSDLSFFVASDAGRTLKLPNVPELKITIYTDTQHVTCQTPSGDWLPGFSVPGSPTNYSVATIYFTDLSTLATYFTQFNTYDTGGATQTTDATNTQFIYERIFLGPAVSGSDWTVNQLGWSDGNGSHNCFGIANLASPDVISVGKKYRVKLNLYSTYTPLDLVGVAVNWGATIGNYTMNIRSVYFGYESSWTTILQSLGGSGCRSNYRTDNPAMPSIYFQGQSGGTDPGLWLGNAGGQNVSFGSYTNGTYKRTKNIRWPDTQSITAAYALFVSEEAGYRPMWVMKPQSGTVTKPIGYWCDWTFPVYWTRNLPT